MKISKSNNYLSEYKKYIPGSKIFNNFDPFEQNKLHSVLQEENLHTFGI